MHIYNLQKKKKTLNVTPPASFTVRLQVAAALSKERQPLSLCVQHLQPSPTELLGLKRSHEKTTTTKKKQFIAQDGKTTTTRHDLLTPSIQLHRLILLQSIHTSSCPTPEPSRVSPWGREMGWGWGEVLTGARKHICYQDLNQSVLTQHESCPGVKTERFEYKIID